MARNELLHKVDQLRHDAVAFFTLEERRKIEKLLDYVHIYQLLGMVLVATIESPLHSIHGYKIIEQFAKDPKSNINRTTIYNLLSKFHKYGLIEQVESTNDLENKTRKKYRITEKGKMALLLSTAQKEVFLSQMNEVLKDM